MDELRSVPIEKESRAHGIYFGRPTMYRLLNGTSEVFRGTAKELAEWCNITARDIRFASDTGTKVLNDYQVVEIGKICAPRKPETDLSPVPESCTSWWDRHPGERVPKTPRMKSGRERAL